MVIIGRVIILSSIESLAKGWCGSWVHSLVWSMLLDFWRQCRTILCFIRYAWGQECEVLSSLCKTRATAPPGSKKLEVESNKKKGMRTRMKNGVRVERRVELVVYRVSFPRH